MNQVDDALQILGVATRTENLGGLSDERRLAAIVFLVNLVDEYVRSFNGIVLCYDCGVGRAAAEMTLEGTTYVCPECLPKRHSAHT